MIDINKTREKLKQETQADLASKHAKDTSKRVEWVPLFSRIKIERAQETLSSLVQTVVKDPFVRGKIIAVGPEVGWRDGKHVHPELKPGTFIIYQKAHEIVYRDAHGTEHVFLKDQNSDATIIAIENEQVSAT